MSAKTRKKTRRKKVSGNMSRAKMRKILIEELTIACDQAVKHKWKSVDALRFLLHRERNIIKLADSMLDGTYKPGRSIAFIVFRPVVREIFAAPFRDRVVHHYLFNQVAKWWDQRFIKTSFSCRIGKGTLYGVDKLESAIRAVSKNYTREAYVIKIDIRGYFMNMRRKDLYKRVKAGLDLQFRDNPSHRDFLAQIWREVIMDDPVKGVRTRGPLSNWTKLPKSKSLFFQLPGVGIVIGNLTSQLLSNIFLNEIDHFMHDKDKLGYKYYGRYVDDSYLVVTGEELPQALKDIREKLKPMLAEMGLMIHPKKFKVIEVSKGVEFLGMVLYPGFRSPSKRFKKSFYEAAEEVSEGKKSIESLISYDGYLRYVNARHFRKKVYDKFGLRYEF